LSGVGWRWGTATDLAGKVGGVQQAVEPDSGGAALDSGLAAGNEAAPAARPGLAASGKGAAQSSGG